MLQYRRRVVPWVAPLLHDGVFRPGRICIIVWGEFVQIHGVEELGLRLQRSSNRKYGEMSKTTHGMG